MQPTLVLGWLLLGLVAPVAAQDGEAAAKPDAKKRLQELQREYRQTMQDWQKQMQEAAAQAQANAERGGSVPAISMRPPLDALMAKYLEAAKDYAKSDDAVDFLLAAMNMTSDRAQAAGIVDTLLTDHLGSTKLRGMGMRLGSLPYVLGEDEAKTVLARLEKDAGDSAVRGWAKLARLEPVLRATLPASAEYVKARAELTEAVAAGDPMLKSQVEQLLVEREKFAEGLVAPEIEGVDLDGVAFKLSDYKGKVVFLDFWGDW